MKVIIAANHKSKLKKLKENMSAMKTIKFLYHCFGLIEINRYFSIPNRIQTNIFPKNIFKFFITDL